MQHSQQPLGEFLEQLAAKQPTPGGGSASALGGALGTALASMAANYTVGNEKYNDFDAAARHALSRLAELRSQFMRLMAADMTAYEQYRAAVALPKISTEEKAARTAAINLAREESTRVPETILQSARAGLAETLALAQAVNPYLAGDVASAAYFLEACARGAAVQIYSNCASADDSGANARRRQDAAMLVVECQSLREKIHAAVLAMLKIAD